MTHRLKAAHRTRRGTRRLDMLCSERFAVLQLAPAWIGRFLATGVIPLRRKEAENPSREARLMRPRRSLGCVGRTTLHALRHCTPRLEPVHELVSCSGARGPQTRRCREGSGKQWQYFGSGVRAIRGVAVRSSLRRLGSLPRFPSFPLLDFRCNRPQFFLWRFAPTF